MSKIAIGTAVRLAARWNGRRIKDLVARGTGDTRDDDEVGDEELEREPGHVRLNRVAACHALERRDRGCCAIGRIQRWKTASAERRKKLTHVRVEGRVAADLELHDLRTARLRGQEVHSVHADRGGAQASY